MSICAIIAFMCIYVSLCVRLSSYHGSMSGQVFSPLVMTYVGVKRFGLVDDVLVL